MKLSLTTLLGAGLLCGALAASAQTTPAPSPEGRAKPTAEQREKMLEAFKAAREACKDSPDKRALLARYEQRGLPLVVLHKPSGEAASKVTSFVEAERLLELMREARTL